MFVFKTYLKNLESHLSDFLEHHRANIFLTKLKSKLKNKLLSTDTMLKIREEILTQTIMQKKTLKRQHENDSDDHDDEKDSDKSENQKSKNRQKKHVSFESTNSSDKSKSQFNQQKSQKRRASNDNASKSNDC